MCGIIGFVTPDPSKNALNRVAVLQQGLFVDSLRGTGGTGIGLVTQDYGIGTFRRALSGPDFLNSQVSRLAFAGADRARVAIGHNRAATIGSIKDENCHPFHFKEKNEILMVHNGTLNNHNQLSPCAFTHDVDSAHAAMALAAEEDHVKLLKSVRGPFVFIWWNNTNKTFNIARNEFRDIYYIRASDGTMYFASEYPMLNWLLDRNDVDVPKKSNFVYLEDHQWCSWKMEGDKLQDKPTKEDITPEKPVNRYPIQHGNHDYSDIYHDRVRVLAQYGLEIGDLMYCDITEYELYNGSTDGVGNDDRVYGKLKMRAPDEDGEPTVWVHSVTRTMYKRLMIKALNGKGIPIRVKGVENDYKSTPMVKVVTGELRPEDLSLAITRKRGGKKNEIKEDSLSSIELYKGPRGTLIGKHLWLEYTSNGCVWCNQPVSMEQHDKIVWIENSTPEGFICGTCAEDNEVLELAGVARRISQQ